MRNLYLYTHNKYSEGAKQLSQHLLVRRIRHKDSRFKGHPRKTVINWGCSVLPDEVMKCRILNHPAEVDLVSQKLRFFNRLEGKGLTPAFTTHPNEAQKWVEEGHTAVCRTLTRASGGRGIVMVQDEEVVPVAPLYTRYIPKQDEYRVHVFDNEIVDVQKKMRKHDHEDPDWQIRNLEGGFVYGREGVNAPDRVEDTALLAFEQFDLHFGAVDVIYVANKDRAYALEINSAPGLEGQTVVSYAGALKHWL